MKEVPRPVNLARSDYQPGKAALEEPIDMTRPNGTLPTLKEMARAALQPVSVNWKHRPEGRR